MKTKTLIECDSCHNCLPLGDGDGGTPVGWTVLATERIECPVCALRPCKGEREAWTTFYAAIVAGAESRPGETNFDSCANMADKMLVEWRKRYR